MLHANEFVHGDNTGKAVQALMRRWRKHMTDLLSSNQCAFLHPKMTTTNLSHNGSFPDSLEQMASWLVSVRGSGGMFFEDMSLMTPL